MRDLPAIAATFALLFAVAEQQSAAPPSQAQHAYSARIVRVIDGDTVEADLTCSVDSRTTIIFHQQRLRLAGIDCPESKTHYAQWLAAGQYLRGRLDAAGNRCTVETDAWDSFGRRLATIRIGQTNVNEEMIELNYAVRYKQ